MSITAVVGRAAPPARDAPVFRRPNQLAERITGRPYLSHSQLSTMRGCPQRFAFQYVEQVRPDYIGSSLVLGGAIHRALELHFRAMLEGLETTLQALLSAYYDGWRQQTLRDSGIPVRFNKNEDESHVHALAERMIRAFLDSQLAQPKGIILGIEEEL